MRRSRSECTDLLTYFPKPARCVLRRQIAAGASGLNRPLQCNYAAKPVVHSQSPPTSDLIRITHVLQFDYKPSNLLKYCNFKYLFISDLSPSIIFDKVYVHSITVLKELFPATINHSTHGK